MPDFRDHTYSRVEKKISDASQLIEIFTAYFDYAHSKKSYLKRNENKRIELGTPTGNKFEMGFDSDIKPKLNYFFDLSVKACRKLQEINDLPQAAHSTYLAPWGTKKYLEDKVGKPCIFFNHKNGSYGSSYDINEEIITFFMVNSEKSTQYEVLKESNYSSDDAVYKEIVQKTMQNVRSVLPNAKTFDIQKNQ